MKTKAEALVIKVSRDAETYWHFHDRAKARELAVRALMVINKRYANDREKLVKILLQHCGFAFLQNDAAENLNQNKNK